MSVCAHTRAQLRENIGYEDTDYPHLDLHFQHVEGKLYNLLHFFFFLKQCDSSCLIFQAYEVEPTYPDDNVYEQGDDVPRQDDATYESKL